jgi:hypothetical protein
MIEYRGPDMDKRILDAYYEFRLAQVRVGIIDDSLTENIDDERSMDERMIEILRVAGKLPGGWDREATRVGLIATANDRSRFAREISRQPTKPRSVAYPPEITGGWLRAS